MMTIQAQQVLAVLNRLANWNRALWLEEVGKHNKAEIRQRIYSTKRDPEGGAWPPWRESTARKRNKKGNAEQGLLWDEGHLLNSIRSEIVGWNVQTGSDVHYGRYLQYGTQYMEERPFIGWSPEDIVWVEGSLVAHLNALTL